MATWPNYADLWHATRLRCEHLASYTHAALLRLSHALQMDLWVRRTPLALAVLFRQPNQAIVRKYSLS